MNKEIDPVHTTEYPIKIDQNQRTRGSTAKTGFDLFLTKNFLAYQKERKASLHALLLLLRE